MDPFVIYFAIIDIIAIIILCYMYTLYVQNQAEQQRALELQQVQEMALMKQQAPKQEMFKYKYAY